MGIEASPGEFPPALLASLAAALPARAAARTPPALVLRTEQA